MTEDRTGTNVRRRERNTMPENARVANTPGSDELFRLMIESVKDYSIFTTDAEGRVTSWNVGAEVLFGYTEAEILGQGVEILFTPEERERGAPEWERRTATAEGRVEDERWLLRKDGTRFWVSGLTMALKDDDENLRGFVKVGRDLTERRQAEETLRKAHAELDNRVEWRTHELVTANILLKDEIAERKRVEEDSRKFKFISDNASDAHFLCDLNGRIVYANRVACEQRGYTQEEMLRLTIPELDPVYPHDRLMKFFERAKKERVPPFEVIHKRKDGSIFPVEITSTYFEFEEKAFLFSAVRDITKRKHAEETLRESEERLRLTFDGLKDYAIYMLDAEGYIKSWNEGATRLKGYRAEEIIGQHDSVCFTPEDVALGKPAKAFAQAAAKGQHEVEQLVMRKDGTRFWANVLFTTIRDEGGLLRGFVGFTRDITERRQMEVALRESEKKYRTLFNSNLDGLGYFNLKGEFLDANPAYLTMLGYSFEELKMKIYQDFTPVKWADFEADIVKNQILARGYSDEYEKEYIRKDGTIFPVNIRAWRVDDEAGNPIGMSVIARDITERKQAEERKAIQYGVTRILAESTTLAEALPQILKTICAGMGWDTCEFWVRDRQANVLRCGISWSAVEEEFKEFVASCFALIFERGEGLPGHVWQKKEAIWIADLSSETVFRRAELAKREGLRTACGLPVMLADDVLGVMAFFSRERRERDEDVTKFLAALGSQIGQFIERKRAEEEIERQRRFLREVIDTNPNNIFVKDEAGKYILVNRAQAEAFGTTIEDAIGKTPADFISQQDELERLFQQDEEVRRTAQSKVIPEETITMPKTGEVRWFQTAKVPLVSPDGQVHQILGVSTDITERKRAEEALRESNQQIVTIFESISDGFYALDNEWRYTYLNRHSERILGRKSEDLIGKNIWELFPEAVRTMMYEQYHRALAEQKPVQFEIEYAAFNAWFDVRVYPSPEGLAIYFSDITERKRREEEIERQRRFLREVIDTNPNNIFVKDEAGKYILVNRALAKFFGTTIEDAIGKTPADFISQQDELERLFQQDEEVRRTAQSKVIPEETITLRETGVTCWFQTAKVPLVSPDGQVHQILGVSTDITERKQAEERLKENERQAAFRTDVSLALGESGTLRSLLQQCAEAVVTHLGAAFARVWILKESQGEGVLELCASAGMYTHTNGAHARIPVGKFKIGLIAQELLPHLTNDVQKDPLISDPEWAQREGMVSFAGYPLILEKRLVGVVGMFAREALTADVLAAFSLVSDVIAQGIERKRAEEKLEQSEESYRRLVELSPDAVLVHSEGQIQYINAVGINLFGATRADQLLGKTVFDLIHPDFHKIVKERIQQTLAGKKAELMELKFLRLNGQSIDVEVTGIGVTYLGKPATQVIIRDITERVRARGERVQLQLRLIAAQEEERRRLSRELHDQLGQYFPALMLGLESLKGETQNRKALTERLQHLQDLSERIARDVHSISRDLRSSELDDFGIQPALASYAENWSKRHDIVVDFQSNGFEEDERLAPHVETTLYRIVQEAFTNVLRHAEAQHMSLILERGGTYARVIVEDDGRGFVAEETMNAPMAKRRLGLLGMEERVALIGGTLEVESSPGAGTTIVVRVPITKETT